MIAYGFTKDFKKEKNQKEKNQKETKEKQKEEDK